MPHTTVTADGSFDFSTGVNSQALTTIESALTPHGLKRSQLAWLTNATVRGGAITQRTGWQPLARITDGLALYQGGILYHPFDGSNPYFLLSFGGRIILYNPTTGIIRDLMTDYPVVGVNPPNVDQAFFLQAEEFCIIQAGDGVTPALFWDGEPVAGWGLRRSIGITTPVAPANTYGINEIPPATAMDYFMDRIWYAQGHVVSAGDIVKGPSSATSPSPFAAPYFGRDSILQVTENPLCFGGDGFCVPENAGNVRAVFHTAELNTSLGEGLLYFGTRKAVYSMQVPITRAKWLAADSTNAPQRKVVQRINGPVNDRSVVHINGDVFYQSLEPDIRSLFLAVRNDTYWGNKVISRNISRAMAFNDRSLMRFCSGIEFDNRMLQCILPRQLSTGQVVSMCIAPLDFDIISSLKTEADTDPEWEGVWLGLQTLQLFTGDFGGLQRAFALMVSETDSSINLWELTTASRTENGDNRVTWVIEFPAYTWGSEFELKKLMAAEIWLDKVFGTVELTLEWREDANPCWHLWNKTSFCAARNSAEDLNNPTTYPLELNYREGYCFPVTFGEPSADCSPNSCQKRPGNIGHQFQPRLTIKGWSRIRGILLYATPIEKGLYERLSC